VTLLYAQSDAAPGSILATLLPFLLIGIIFYFLIIRPQAKQKKQHENMLADIKKGDKVLTRGGLYGNVVNFQGKNNQKVLIELGSGIKVNIARSYIVSLSENNDSGKSNK